MQKKYYLCAFFVKTMADIQEKDRIYDFFHPLVNRMFRCSFRHITYIGKENIPTDGAVIFAPNHVNALCDAMAILTIDNKRKVFVARADMFKNKKAAWLLNGLKIMPIRRMRDGANEVLKNDETEDKAIATLHDGVPFCILPEGTHRPMHSLLPLGKGVFRIALRAYEEFGQEKPIYIVPVGLEYGDYFHLWNTLYINIGKPINISQQIRDFESKLEPGDSIQQSHTRAILINELRDILTQRMREQIMWVPDDEHYDENFKRLSENPPKPFDKFKKHRIPKWLLIVCLVILSPLFLVSAIVTFPLWLVWFIIRSVVKDPAFHNSVQFLWQFVWIPLTLFITLPFWMFLQEYVYQARKLKNSNN